MPGLKPKEIRTMKREEIESRLSELRLELAKERANVSMGRAIKNPGKIRELRKSIARILTIKKQVQSEVKK